MQHLVFTTQASESQGDMPKSWNAQHTRLYKYSTPIVPKLRETESEWICCRLAKVLGIDCVQYNYETIEIELFGKCFVDKAIVCNTFLGADEQLITPMNLCTTAPTQQTLEYVMQVNPRHFHQMRVFDYLVCNTDRHLNNYGFIRSDTGYRAAPVFDNDKALFSTQANDNSPLFREFDPYLRSRAGFHASLYKDAVSIIQQYGGLNCLFNLNGFEMYLRNIVNAVPTDMTKQRRQNIINLVMLQLKHLEG